MVQTQEKSRQEQEAGGGKLESKEWIILEKLSNRLEAGLVRTGDLQRSADKSAV